MMLLHSWIFNNHVTTNQHVLEHKVNKCDNSLALLITLQVQEVIYHPGCCCVWTKRVLCLRALKIDATC